MSLSNFSIGKRLAVVLGLILVLSAASSLFAIERLQRLSTAITTMVSDNVATERSLSDWLRYTNLGVERSAAIAKSADASLIDYFAVKSADAVRMTTELQKKIEEQMDTPDEKRLYAKTGEARKVFLASRDAVRTRKAAGDAAGTEEEFTKRFEPSAATYLAAVQDMVNSQRSQLDAAAQVARDDLKKTTFLLVGCLVVSITTGVLLAWYLTLSITRPLRRAQAMAQTIAGMDLTEEPLTHYNKDETGSLLKSIDTMRAALTRTLQEVRGAVDGISTASSQIASGNQDLSSRTEQTASNLQQTASSMEEMTGTVQQSADSASQANALASSAAKTAQRGGAVVSQVVTTMDDINASSKRIADIIGVIDGIAFQTNILALNAAVEAARAGEQGRGFAVVASEVRSLAQRSAAAAKEIKGLIGESVDKVAAGSKLVQDAGQTMGEIVTSVQRVTDMIGEITHAATEQSQGIGQINNSVTQLDEMTQQNAALVEESAAAAASLQDQAQRLAGVVGTFRLSTRQAAMVI